MSKVKSMLCHTCGDPLPDGGRGRHNRMYCSAACRDSFVYAEAYGHNVLMDDDLLAGDDFRLPSMEAEI